MPNTRVRVYLQGYKPSSRGLITLQMNLENPDIGGSVVQAAYRRNRTDVRPAIVSGTLPLVNKNCVVNWGVPENLILLPPVKNNYFLLNSYGTRTASDKREFFQGYAGIAGLSLPWYTTRHSDAMSFVNEARAGEAPVLVERHTLTGHSGNGIRFVRAGQEVSTAPLYVAYKKKKDEYRVHFFKHANGETSYFTQQKRMRRDVVNSVVENNNRESKFKIRNKENGWVFCHQHVVVNHAVQAQAERFAAVTPLDFGAIDIIFNQRENTAYILEVNTAPGIEGETGLWYARNIVQACSRHNFNTTGGDYRV